MKCKICKTEQGLDVFSTSNENTYIIDIESLRGICYYCYMKVPKYIPKQQVKRWLYHEMQKL